LNADITIERFSGLREMAPDLPPLEQHDACPVCDASAGVDLAELEGSLVTRMCDGCGHIFRSRRPPDAWFRDWYRSDWDTGEAPADEGRVRTLLKALRWVRNARSDQTGIREPFEFCRAVIAKDARVLDVGCGYGGTLRPFAASGSKTHGIEPSPHRARIARLLGAEVRDIAIEELAPDTFGGPMDLVLTNHVLEHIVDPYEYLRRVRAVLRPGGHLFIGVPNAGNDFLLQHAFYALHVHLFSRSSLELLLRRAGFAVQRVAEDHQLRVLARRTDDADSAPPPVHGAAQDREQLLERLVGPRRAWQEGATIYCKWSLLPLSRMLSEPYAVEWSPDREPLAADRVIGLCASGRPELPVVFKKRDSNGATPFWVK
jgi:2-polyprenyl-3-methyl-5-hydroxy-6-metoxy-1,4-benzoquinol methylase